MDTRISSPTVSVVIPVYNGTNYLRDAVDSVLAQTFTDYEVLVVDDGSTDGTWDVIQSYGDRVRGFRKPNGGVGSALNQGIIEARGKYIAWLSHDDMFMPNKLERQVAFLESSPRFKACYTDCYFVDPRGKVFKKIDTPWYPRERAIRVLFGRMYINGSTMLIERSCFDQVGLFNEQYKYTQDAEQWLRMLHCFEIGRVPEKLLKSRAHPDQGSCNRQVHAAEAMAMYHRMFEELGVAGVFPELATLADAPDVKAWAYRWLGDTMAYYRGWFTFADEQYSRSAVLWPSWRNPARFKLAVGAKNYFWPRRFYWWLRHTAAGIVKGSFSLLRAANQ